LISDWFKDNLLDLLSPLYEHNDEAGDLRTFLSLPAGTLDELKQAIDDFPTIFDVDHCDKRFLSLLARLVGLEVDGICSPDCQRRRVWEAVEIYRRKGTIPAIERDFNTLDWQGELQRNRSNGLRPSTTCACHWNPGTASAFSLAAPGSTPVSTLPPTKAESAICCSPPPLAATRTSHWPWTGSTDDSGEGLCSGSTRTP